MISPNAAVLERWYKAPQLMVRELFGATPDAWQDEVLATFPSTPRIAMKASKGPGKEICKDTIVPTPQGDCRFGNLEVGDLVFAEDGAATRITAVYDNGIKPVWRVTFDDGSSVLAGADHQWKVRGAAERMRKHARPYQRATKCDEVWSVLTTEQVIERGVRVKNGRWAGRQFEIPLHGAAQYPESSQALDPYLAGVWLGDGHRGEPCYSKPYDEVWREIQRRGYRISHGGLDRVRILDAIKLFRDALPCFGAYSFERFVPAEFKYASAQQRRDILCGLMDTDGGIEADGHMEFGSTSKLLAEDVVWLARSLGGNAFIKGTVKQGRYKGKAGENIECRDCYRVTVRLPFCPFRIAHKAERWVDPLRSNSTSRYMKRYIDSIEPAGEADCMCIEVEHPSKCYLINDFIVTHNSCVMAWLGWNFLLTRPHPNIAATSISGDNLRDGLWKEMAHWRNKVPMLQEKFEWQTERIFARESPATWFMSARAWSKSANAEQIGNTLAGLHSDYIMFLIDEAGSIPTAITMSAEAAFSSAVECHILQAGNTNSLEGALFDACVTRKHLWRVVPITGDPDDQKRSTRVSIEWAREMIKTYGRDNPFVKVMVLGEWPAASVNALLGPEDIERAQARRYQQYDIEGAPKILGVDVARFGDDASCIFPRQGLVAFKPKLLRNVTGNEGAGQLSRTKADWGADAIFIDNSGGYGASWIDACARLNITTIPVDFSGKPSDPRYYNKRAQMHFEAAQWVKNGGQLPDDPELVAEATQTTYTFKGDRLIMEDKGLVKAKIGRSPDRWDAFVLTHAEPVVAATATNPRRREERPYDPIAEMLKTGT